MIGTPVLGFLLVGVGAIGFEVVVVGVVVVSGVFIRKMMAVNDWWVELGVRSSNTEYSSEACREGGNEGTAGVCFMVTLSPQPISSGSLGGKSWGSWQELLPYVPVQIYVCKSTGSTIRSTKPRVRKRVYNQISWS
jgi:hypothetical protein